MMVIKTVDLHNMDLLHMFCYHLYHNLQTSPILPLSFLALNLPSHWNVRNFQNLFIYIDTTNIYFVFETNSIYIMKPTGENLLENENHAKFWDSWQNWFGRYMFICTRKVWKPLPKYQLNRHIKIPHVIIIHANNVIKFPKIWISYLKIKIKLINYHHWWIYKLWKSNFI